MNGRDEGHTDLRVSVKEPESYEPDYECTIAEVLRRLTCNIYGHEDEIYTGTARNPRNDGANKMGEE